VRIVAQPVVGFNEFEAAVAASMPVGHFSSSHLEKSTTAPSNNWGFADGALHLFFELDESQARTIALALAALKKQNSDLCPTSQLPLGVHPCLTKEAFAVGPEDAKVGGFHRPELFDRIPGAEAQVPSPENRRKWKGISYAAGLRDILMKHAVPEVNLRRVAMMLSKELRTPWMFLQFEAKPARSNKDPVRLQLAVIPILDPNAQQISQTAASASSSTNARDEDSSRGPKENKEDAELVARRELRESSNRAATNFNQRKILVVPRSAGTNQDIGIPGVGNTKAALASARIAKRPKSFADSLDIFLRTKSGFQDEDVYQRIIQDTEGFNATAPHNIAVTGKRGPDLMRVASRIENPFLNNDFTTDCASCHYASAEKLSIESVYFGSSQDDPRKSPPRLKQMMELIGKDTLEADNISAEAMPALRGVTPATTLPYRRIDDAFLAVYVTNQFSIYKQWPQVSTRVANESAVSAYLANNWYLDGAPAHPYTCDPIKLQRCFLAAEMAIRGISNNWLTSDWNQVGACFREEVGICKRE
jgi:hypothetical protein